MSLGDVVIYQDVVHDAAGNPKTLVQAREDGAKRTVTIDYDPFGLQQTSVQIEGTGGPGAVAALRTTMTVDPLTLNITNTTDPTEASIGAVYDGFDRQVVATATPAGGTIGAVATTQYAGFAVGQGGKRSIKQKVFTDLVPVDQAGTSGGRVATTYLDAAGRQISSIVELGADYQGKMLVVGARSYDTLGRVAFEADPFEVGQFAGTAYGTTHYFNTDGTPLASIRGSGPQPYTVSTNEAAQIYPITFVRSFEQFQEVFSTKDASANLADGAQKNVTQSTYRNALGQTMAQATWKDGVRLELATYSYDGLRRMSAMTRYRLPAVLQDTMTWRWTYDSLGQMVELDESNRFGVTRRWSYDNWGEVVSSNYNDGGLRDSVNRYDSIGRLIHSEDQNSGVTDEKTKYDYTYDQAVNVAGRLTPTNVLGRLAQTRSPTTKVSYSYDGLGRVNARAFTDDSVAAKPVYVEKYARHSDGSTQSLVLNLPDNSFRDERVDYGYDSAGRPKSVNFSDGVSSQNLFDAADIDVFGRVIAAKYGVTDYAASYDLFGRMLMTNMSIASGTHSRHIAFPAAATETPAFDPIGRERRRTEIVDGVSPKAISNAYDALGRINLRQVRDNGSLTSSALFGYDALGNVTDSNDFVGGHISHAFSVGYIDTDRDQMNCLEYGVSAPGNGCPLASLVAHDAAGNVIREPSPNGAIRNFQYYAGGSVKQITDGQSQADFLYDAFGDVQKLTLSSTTTVNARNDQHFSGVLSQRNEMNSVGVFSSVLTRSIPGPGGIVATRHGPSGPWIFGFGENRGTRFFTDETGAFVQDVSYRAYGEAGSSRAPGTARYSSNQWNDGDLLEAFGLVQLGARIYDPVIGRFLSRDPLLIPRTAATTNPYAFAMNDPVNLSDPSGLDPSDNCDSERCGRTEHEPNTGTIYFGAAAASGGGWFGNPNISPINAGDAAAWLEMNDPESELNIGLDAQSAVDGALADLAPSLDLNVEEYMGNIGTFRTRFGEALLEGLNDGMQVAANPGGPLPKKHTSFGTGAGGSYAGKRMKPVWGSKQQGGGRFDCVGATCARSMRVGEVVSADQALAAAGLTQKMLNRSRGVRGMTAIRDLFKANGKTLGAPVTSTLAKGDYAIIVPGASGSHMVYARRTGGGAFYIDDAQKGLRYQGQGASSYLSQPGIVIRPIYDH